MLAQRCSIHPGVRIGTRGFGFDMSPDGHLDVPQLGRVIVGDDVEIGANSSIDRGSGPDTIIGDGCKIDNLVQIGHNVEMGKGMCDRCPKWHRGAAPTSQTSLPWVDNQGSLVTFASPLERKSRRVAARCGTANLGRNWQAIRPFRHGNIFASLAALAKLVDEEGR